MGSHVETRDPTLVVYVRQLTTISTRVTLTCVDPTQNAWRVTLTCVDPTPNFHACNPNVVTRVHSRGERGRMVRVFRAVYVFPYGRPLFLPLLPPRVDPDHIKKYVGFKKQVLNCFSIFFFLKYIGFLKTST